MEASPCSSMNGWSFGPVESSRCGKLDAVDDTWVNKMPVIKPCYYGMSLQIHDELVRSGLSAISIKHHRGIYCDSIPEVTFADRRQRPEGGRGNEEEDGKSGADHWAAANGAKKHSVTGLPKCWKEKMKRRNSFWNMHRPELSKLKWPGHCISPAVLQDFFHHHLRSHSTFCGLLHADGNRASAPDQEIRDSVPLRELLPPTSVAYDEKAASRVEKNLSIQLNDEDLEPETIVHKSKAEFCVVVGERERKPNLKEPVPEEASNRRAQTTGHLERPPAPRGFPAKEEEEVVSCSAGDPTGSGVPADRSPAV